MSYEDLLDDLEELSSAEDFLNYFEVEFEPSVVQVNRLHILQRYHNYLSESPIPEDDEAAARQLYQSNLQRAYMDFVGSSAAEQKVLRIYKAGEPQVAKISIDAITRSQPDATPV